MDHSHRLLCPSQICAIWCLAISCLIPINGLLSQAGPSDWFGCDIVSTTNCDDIPSLFVDLRNSPSQKWYSCKIARGDKDSLCCGIAGGNNDQCIEFKVLLHPDAYAILLEIPEANEQEWQDDQNSYNGSNPVPPSPGAKPSINTYRINCGPLQGGAQGDEPACLTSAILNDTIFITFCQTGNNENVYRIKSLKAELNPDFEILAEGCGNQVTVSGQDINVSTISWNSTQDPAYNAYVNPPMGDTSVVIYVPKNAPLPPGNPPTLEYDVCVDPIGAGLCPNLNPICTTVQVLVLSPPDMTITAPTVCPSGPFYAEIDNPPAGGILYTWYDDWDGNGAAFPTNNTNHTFSTPGNKSVIVEDQTITTFGYDDCAYDTLNFTIDTFPTPPAVISGPTDICIVNNSYQFTADDAGPGARYIWNFGAGANPATHNALNNSGRVPPQVTYNTCGDKTITLQVVSSDGCTDNDTYTVLGDTEPPVITCPPNLTLECDDSFDPANTGTATATDNCGYHITYNDVIVPGPCPGEYTINRTWTATDSCGLFDDCVQTINVVDTTPPTFNCDVTPLVLECDQNYTAEINTWLNTAIADLEASSSDNCGVVTATHDWTGDLPALSCLGSTPVTVTFTVSDDCNNSLLCTSTISIEDTQPPVVNCVVDDLVLECGDNYLAEIAAWIATAEADLINASTDACGGPLTADNDWNGSDVPVLDCAGVTGIEVIFTVIDACLNETPCTTQVILNDTTPPTFVCPDPELILECDADYLSEIAAWIASVESNLESIAGDNCSSTFTADNDWNGTDVPTLDCNNATGLTINFWVTDDCGNVSELCPGSVRLNDTQPPVVTCVVSDLVLQCDNDYLTEIQNWIDQTEQDLINAAVDDCNQPLTADNDWNGSDVPTLDCSGTTGITVRFWVLDACDNADTCDADVILVDTIPPVVNCEPDDLVLECDQDYLGEINSWISTTMADLLACSFDECSHTVLTMGHDWDGVSFPALSCDLSDGLPVEFYVIDNCQDTTTRTATIYIEDTTDPVVTFPSDYEIPGCNVNDIVDLPYSESEQTIDLTQFQGVGGNVVEACNSTFTITYYDSIIAICPLQVRRVFRVVDECDNESLGPQIITIRDSEIPQITCPQGPIVEGCRLADLDNLTGLPYSVNISIIDVATFNGLDGQSNVTDNCGVREINYRDSVMQASCPLIVRRFFTVYDSCDLSNSCFMDITVEDTEPPTIICPESITREGCDVSALLNETGLAFSTVEITIDEQTFDGLDAVSAADDVCGILEVRYIDVISQASCPLVVTRTFTAYDSCGLFTSCTQEITIEDTEPPTLFCPGDIQEEGCDVNAVANYTLPYSSVPADISESTFDALDGVSAADDICGIELIQYMDVITQESCPLILERTFTVYDSCGLNTSCTQEIIIEDTEPPTITCPGPVQGDGCDVSAIVTLTGFAYSETETSIGESAFNNIDGLSLASDICGVADVTYYDSISNVSCPLEVVRRFIAYDSCGLNTSCTQVITVVDQEPPQITCPVDQTLEGCGTYDLELLTGLAFSTAETLIDEVTFEGLPLPGDASDNCGIEAIGYFDVIENPSCPLIIRRTFTAYDSCGLTNVCEWVITIDDTQPPELTCPEDILEEGCGIPDVEAITGLPYSATTTALEIDDFNAIDANSNVGDQCGIRDFSYRDSLVQASCPFIFERIFIAVDSCDLVTRCNQRIILEDTEPPVITCPEDVQEEGCSTVDILALSGLPFNTVITSLTKDQFDLLDVQSLAEDVCGILEVTYQDQIVQQSCPIMVERIFIAYDSCGLFAECVQSIIVEDTQAPVIVCPEDVSGEGCNLDAVVSISQLPYSPTESIIDAQTFAALDGVSSVSDVCGVFEIKYQDQIDQPSCPILITRTFTAVDSCGLESVCSQEIEVHDTETPTITCPADIVVDACSPDDLDSLTGLEFSSIERSISKTEFDQLDGISIVDDICGIREVGYIDVLVEPNCPVIVHRTFIAYDSCGLTATCLQVIQLNPIPLADPICPGDLTVESCLTQVDVDQLFDDWKSQFSYPGDGCNLDISLIDTIDAPPFCGGSKTIDFTVVDQCGNQKSCASTFTIPTAPVLTMTCAPDLVFQCRDDVPLPYGTVDQFESDGGQLTNTCGLVANSFRLVEENSDGNTCPEIIARTYRAEDICGHIVECTQTIRVNDTIPPQLIGVPADITIPCEQVPDPPVIGVEITAEDNCDLILPEYTQEIIPGICENTYSIIRTWYAEDACGNNVQAVQNITVTDCRPEVEISINPNPVCLDGSVTFDAVITNNYTNPIYRWQFLWNGTWVDVPGGNEVPFIMDDIENSDGGRYRLLIADNLQNLGNFDCNVVSDEETLEILQPTITNLAESICDDETYVVGTSTYTETGSYTDTLTGSNGCDSIVHLDLTVLESTEGSLDTTICEGDRFSLGGSTFFSDGQYVVHILNQAGCDSTVTIRLRVQIPSLTVIRDTICEGESTNIANETYTESGDYTQVLTDQFGCDSTLQISIHVIPVVHTTLDETICTGDTYTFDNNPLTSSGTYTSTIPSLITGCDSVITLNLEVLDQIEVELSRTICTGDSVQVGPNWYRTPGTYMETLQSTAGCDSIVTLNLNVVDDFVTDLNINLCEGESYQVGSSTYSESGSYTDLLTSSAGCDSTVNLNLTIYPHRDTTITAEICSGDHVIVGGDPYNTTGVYQITLPSVNGCDSNIVLDLTVHQAFDTTYNVDLCTGESITLGEESYSTSGTYQQSFTNAAGCDSVITIIIEVSDRYEETRDVVLCVGESYQVGSNTYTSTGNYTDSLQSKDGCDSIIHLNLIVVENIQVELDEQICEGQSFKLGSTTHTESGTYTETFQSDAGCDSIVTVNLQVLSILRDTTRETICEGETFDFDGTPYQVGGTYEKDYTSVAGCDSIHTLVLVVMPVQRTTIQHQICAGDSVVLGESAYTQSGSYVETLTSANGCDSIVTLVLQVTESASTVLTEQICANETYPFGGVARDSTGTYVDSLVTATGCDSIVTLHLTVNPTFSEEVSAQICVGQIFPFDGQSLSTAGQYTASLLTSTGCDSTVILHLEVVDQIKTYDTATICQGGSVDFFTQSLDQAGTYDHTLQSAAGCDSIVHMTVEVVDKIQEDITVSLCEGDSYTFGDRVLDSTGVYVDSLSSSAGCDSIVTLDLTVNPSYKEEINARICETGSYNFMGQSLTETGIYVDSLQTLAGCDSIVTLNLVVQDVILDTINVTICQGQSYTFDNRSFDETGVHTAIYITAGGCDSTVVLDLLVVDQITTNIDQEICEGDSVVINEKVYKVAGSFSETLVSSGGCDSVLQITISEVSAKRQVIDETICAGESFSFNGSTYTETTSFTDTLTTGSGCDSIVEFSLQVLTAYEEDIYANLCTGSTYTFDGETYNESGTYELVYNTAGGCDSIIRLHISIMDEIRIEESTTICLGDSVLIGGKYYTENITVVDSATTVSGCDSIVVYEVIVVDDVTIVGDTVQICEGESVELIPVITGTPSSDITWSPAEGLSCQVCTNPVASPTESTTYLLSTTGCLGTNIEVQYRVEIIPNPVLVLSQEEGPNGNHEIVLSATTIDPSHIISWYDHSGQNICTDCQSILRPNNEASYTATAINSLGCEVSEEINTSNTFEDSNCDPGVIEASNAFTPNGDGHNDYFQIINTGDAEVLSVQVYNRWGEIVFEGSGSGDMWDGNTRGVAANPGVFIYLIDGICATGEKFVRAGNVTLIR